MDLFALHLRFRIASFSLFGIWIASSPMRGESHQKHAVLLQFCRFWRAFCRNRQEKPRIWGRQIRSQDDLPPPFPGRVASRGSVRVASGIRESPVFQFRIPSSMLFFFILKETYNHAPRKYVTFSSGMFLGFFADRGSTLRVKCHG